MELVQVIARLFLAAVFAVAGLTKLRDYTGSRQALVGFGVPTALARPLGLLLPLAELTVAVALLPAVSAWWGALGALILLLIFVTGIGYNLARGRRPECHCFGQLHSAPAGWSTLIRNLLLAVVAGFVVGLGRTTTRVGVFNWLGLLTLTQLLGLCGGILIVALLAFESWGLFQSLKQQGRLLLRLEAIEAQLAANGTPSPLAPTREQIGLPVRSVAPSFELTNLDGEKHTLAALCALGKPVLLLFSNPDCGPCTALLPEVGRWQRAFASKLTLVLMSRGTPEANRAKLSREKSLLVLLQQDNEVAQAYQAPGTPQAVLVLPNGTIGSPLAQGADAIRSLVTAAVKQPGAVPLPMAASSNGHVPVTALKDSSKLRIGDPAPAFTLPDLAGKPVALTDFRGTPTLVFFWNPGCGFCQRMLEDLKTWENRATPTAPRLLLVSRGTKEANEALGLRSPLVLDEGFLVGEQFGVNGTPQAVLVDAQGSIVSEVAAGASAVLALAEQVPTNPR